MNLFWWHREQERKKTRRPAPRDQKPRWQPRVEMLEDRVTPATHTANSVILTPDAVLPSVVVTASWSTQPTNPVSGQSVTLTATVSGNSGTPTGMVEFFDNGSPIDSSLQLVNGVQMLTTSSLISVGSHMITAEYFGDATYGANTSAPTDVTVTQGMTSVSAVAATPTAGLSVGGINMTVLAVAVQPVSPATGTPSGAVTFFDNGTPIGVFTLSGANTSAYLVTAPLTGGSHTFTASYEGDTNFLPSDDISKPTLPITVAPVTSTTTLVASASSVTQGSPVTFTATITGARGSFAPTGTVTFKDGNTTLGTGTLNASGVATFTTSSVSIGSHTVTATYGGDTNNTNSTSNAVTVTVTAPPVPTPIPNSAQPAGTNITGLFAITKGAVKRRPSNPLLPLKFFAVSVTLKNNSGKIVFGRMLIFRSKKVVVKNPSSKLNGTPFVDFATPVGASLTLTLAIKAPNAKAAKALTIQILAGL
jgi:hypothetical protein